jgi:hypothetical protein
MTTKQVERSSFWGKEFLTKGLNATDNPIMVPADEMTLAENILIGSTWARRKRQGQTYYNVNGLDETANYPVNPKNNGDADGPPIRGIHEFWYYSGITGLPQSQLLVRQDDKVWAIDERNVAAIDGTGGNPLPTTGRVCFQTFENQIYWTSTNTAEGYNKWDGISATYTPLGAGAQPADGTPAFLGVYRGRMVAAGVPGFPYRIYFSKVFDAEDWTTGGILPDDPTSLDLDPYGDPQGITGFTVFQDRLYVFLRRSTYEITGDTPETFRVRPISRQVGCINHATIVPVGNDVFYASERGVLSLSSTDKAIESEYAYVSRNIRTIYNEMIDRNREEQWYAGFDERENLYVLSCPSLGRVTNDVCLVYNTEKNAWTTWEGLNARTFATVLINNVPRLITGREDGIIGVTGEKKRLDFGEPYKAKLTTGILYPGQQADIEHIFKAVTIVAAPSKRSSLTLEWSIDSQFIDSRIVNFVNSGDLLGSTFILGESRLSAGTYEPRTAKVRGKGYGIQLTVIMQDDEDIEIFGFIVESVPADHKYR